LDHVNDALERMRKLVTANTKSVSALGARAMVLSKFLDAALPRLTMSQRGEIADSFRHGIEEAMSMMDDVPWPPNITWRCWISPMPSSPHSVTDRRGVDPISYGSSDASVAVASPNGG